MVIRVLSIDGGGMRGVGAAHMLAYLETQLLAAGKPGVADSFDLFVGTSTGAIIAAGLATDGYEGHDRSPAKLRQLYYDYGSRMFTPALKGLNPFGLMRGKYREESKGNALKEVLGEITIGKLKRNFLATSYNIGDGPGPVFVNGGPNYPLSDRAYDSLPLWQVVNASSSAPIYFDPSILTGEFVADQGVDGGLFANNPAMCGYVEARALFGKALAAIAQDDIIVVSFGCGQQSLRFPSRKRWGLLQWAAPWYGMPLLEAMFDGQSATVSHQMKHLLHDRFFRFDFDLRSLGKVALDDARHPDLDRVKNAADASLATSDTKELIKNLVAVL